MASSAGSLAATSAFSAASSSCDGGGWLGFIDQDIAEIRPGDADQTRVSELLAELGGLE